MALVEVDVAESGIGTVTLARADRLNSFNEQMIAELGAALAEASARSRVVVLRAQPGVKVFSAGHDIDDVPVGADPHEWDNPIEAVITGIPRLPVPVIAAVEGTTWGAACNLVVACDLIVAERKATFAITPAKLGVPYFTGGLSLFARSLPLHVVKAMFFTAEPLRAEEAHRYGLVHDLADGTEDLALRTARLAARIAGLAPLTIRSVKAQLASFDPAATHDADELERLRVQAWTSADVREGVTAFRERRRPVFRGE